MDSNDDPETNFPYHRNRDADLRYLKDACVDRFDRNLRLLKRRRRKRNLKFFFIYGVPTIAILVANGFVLKQSRKQDVVPTYSLETTMISDGKMVKDNDTSKYIVTEYDLMEDDSSVIKRESRKGSFLPFRGWCRKIMTISPDAGLPSAVLTGGKCAACPRRISCLKKGTGQGAS